MILVFFFPLLFIFAFILVNGLRLAPKGVGYAWLSSIAISVIALIVAIVFRWQIPAEYVIHSWRPFDPASADKIIFGWDAVSWPFITAVISILVGFLMTSGAREDLQVSHYAWSSKFLVIGLVVFILLAKSPLALLLSWAVFDIAELLINLSLVVRWKFDERHAKVFIGRSIGVFLLIAALVYQREVGTALSFEQMSQQPAMLLLSAILVRAFTTPIIFQHDDELQRESGLVNFLRLMSIAAILAPLSRLDVSGLPSAWANSMIIVGTVLLLVVTFRWVASKEEGYGRPYLEMGTVILVLISVLNEKQNAALALSVALLTSSAVLLLYSIKGRSLRLLSFLGALGISGLPFTPASAGWDGLVSGDLNFWQILLVFSVAMMVAGYLKHGTRISSEFRTFEGWVRALYPTGIFLVILMQWIIVLLGINRGFTNAHWWAPLTVVLFLGFALIWRLMIQNPEKRSSLTYDLYSQLSELNYRLDRIFQIETIERVLDKIIGAIHWIANFVTRLFESSGGILWSLLVLVIFFIVLGSGGR